MYVQRASKHIHASGLFLLQLRLATVSVTASVTRQARKKPRTRSRPANTIHLQNDHMYDSFLKLLHTDS